MSGSSIRHAKSFERAIRTTGLLTDAVVAVAVHLRSAAVSQGSHRKGFVKRVG